MANLKSFVTQLVVLTVCLAVLASFAPTLVYLASGLVPLVVAVGAVIAVLRIVRHYTNRY